MAEDNAGPDLDRWRDEKTAAYLTAIVAQREADPAKRALFAALAQESEEQAALIAKAIGGAPAFRPSARAAVVAALVRLIGPKAMRPMLAAVKVRGLSIYNGPLPAGHEMPTSTKNLGARHQASKGGSLRAAIFGVNDGLLSNTSLLMGVAASGAPHETAILAGTAGLLAGAFSMAAGEYVSVRTQREMFEHQIAQEKAELELYPAEEAEELALIYAARGVPIEDARAMAAKLIADPKVALDVLAREELGLNPDDLGSAPGAAISSFLAFAVGGVVPLVPFVIHAGDSAFVAAALAAISLFGIGAAMSLLSGRRALVGGLRMVGIGALAAGATFLAGKLFGVATG